jgi:alpha-2-macroglobulin-like protein
MSRLNAKGKWIMTRKTVVGGLSIGTLAMAVFGGALPPAAPTPPATGPATLPNVSPAERFQAYVSTDKPIYRPNEKVYIRSILLNAATHEPAATAVAGPTAASAIAIAQLQILGPLGNIVATGGGAGQDSIAAFNWTIPETAAGGEYTLKITYPRQGYAPAQRKFDVRVYRAPRLRSQVTFARDGYGASDKVTATLHTERAEGGLPAGAKVTVTARVDGVQVYTGPGSVDAAGNCVATFDLPKAMERGEGTLAFAIEDGGTVETATKTIPILLQTVDLNIYPEGGDAVAGVDNRFYIEARTPAKKPADLVGAIWDSKGQKVADVKTEHEGRGRFSFAPAKGETYTLKLTEPAGISKTWDLPAARDTGVVLHGVGDIVAKEQPVKFQLAGAAGTYKVTLRRQEAEVSDALTVKLAGAASQELAFNLRPQVDGVLTATVWNEAGVPLAERLVYRQPAHTIKVKVTPGQSTYTPGEKVALNILTTDENDKPIAATVGLTVTDDSVLEMIEKREQAPRLPVMVFLEPEVREIADAHVYLDPANPKAPLATDLLLGTQGWRRFATVNTTEFAVKYGDEALRALAITQPPAAVALARGGARGGGGGAAMGGFGGAAPAGAPQAAAAPMMRAAVPAPAAGPVAADKAAPQLALANEALANRPPVPRPADAPAAAAELAAGGGAGRGRAAAGGGGFGGGAGGGAGGGGAGGGGFGGGGGRGGRGGVVARGPFTVVREYAHELRPGWTPLDRADFAETLYWNAGIKTDDTGRATTSFSLADSVTTYRILADSFSSTGALGANTSTVQSVQAFFIEPKLPLEVSQGDVIQLPLAAVNNTPAALKNVSVGLNLPQGITLKSDAPANADLPANQRVRRIYSLSVGNVVGNLDLTINAGAAQFSDRVTRQLRVVPKGFPTQLAYGGLLEKDQAVNKTFIVPNSVVANSMQAQVAVFPSPVANLTEAVAALMREPRGCFEQTSSTNYPLAMAQMYFVNHQGVDPKLIANANELLIKGYQRLIGFECQAKGYEWFGGSAPGHEALTAYGLMEFYDMQQAKINVVDPAMVQRTKDWLMARRDGNGSFMRNAKAIDSFGGAPAITTDTYIVWALSQAGEKNIDPEIAAVKKAVQASDDSYVIALAANIALVTKDAEAAAGLMEKLARKQGQDGAVQGATSSITRSGGQGLLIEATSLATLAWVQDPRFAGNATQAIKFLADSCKGGRFGSTQSTIMALKAITAYDTANAKPKAPGEVTLMVDDKPVGTPVAFTTNTKEPLKFPDITPLLTPGRHDVALKMADGAQMPFTMNITFNSTTPSTDKQCKLQLDTWLKDAQIVEGNVTEARVRVANTSEKDAASPIAIVGIPGGLEVRHDQLKELVKAGKIDAYEVNGREVVLYWRQLKANTNADISLSLLAAVPGAYTAPASRTYEYYTDEYKQWIDGSNVTITPK